MTGAADVPGHPVERGRGGGRRELPRDRPARLAADHAELALQLELVDLHHHAVDLEVEPVAPLLPALAGSHHLLDRVVHLHVAVHPETVLAHPVEPLVVGLELEPVDLADAVAPHRQRPRGGQRGVELANRTGRRVARVHEGRLAGRGPLLVQAGERRQRQVDLAAHLQQRRGVLHTQRNRADRAQVLGHVLAHLAVPAGGAAHQHAVLVDERDGEAVDLRLGHEVHVAHLHALAREIALAAHHPRGQLLLVARVGEREHRLEVRHLAELVERLASDPLSRRVRRAQLLVVGLEVAQLVQQRVVIRIRDLRVVEDVVAVAVVLELSPQLLGSRRGVACLTQRPLSRDAAGARGRSPRAPPRQPGR